MIMSYYYINCIPLIVSEFDFNKFINVIKNTQFISLSSNSKNKHLKSMKANIQRIIVSPGSYGKINLLERQRQGKSYLFSVII